MKPNSIIFLRYCNLAGIISFNKSKIIKSGFLILVVFLSISCNKDRSIDNPVTLTFQFDRFDNIFLTNDNGFIVAGTKDQNYNLTKVNRDFTIKWTQNNYEWGQSLPGYYSIKLKKLVERNDGTYVCFVESMQGVDDILSSIIIIGINKEGEQIFRKDYADHDISGVIQTIDGGYIIESSYSLMRLDDSLNVLWEKGSYLDRYNLIQIIALDNGGFATTGYFNDESVFINEYTAEGDRIKDIIYNFQDGAFKHTLAFDFIQLEDKGFLFIGGINSINGQDPYLIRSDSNGDTIWTKQIKTAPSELMHRIITNLSTEYIIEGSASYSYRNTILYKIDLNGQVLDSLTIFKYIFLAYSPLKYFIKVQAPDSSEILIRNIEISKIPIDKLFSRE
jgi:hypothetical protein